MCNNYYISYQPTFVSFSKWVVVWKNQWRRLSFISLDHGSKMLKFKILLIEKLKHIKQTFKILLAKSLKYPLQRLGSHDLSHAITILWYATKIIMGLQSFFLLLFPSLMLNNVPYYSCIKHVCKTEVHDALFRPCWQDLASNSRESPTEQFKDR